MITLSELVARGFDPKKWRLALADHEARPRNIQAEHNMSQAHPSNWMSEDEVETPGLLNRILTEAQEKRRYFIRATVIFPDHSVKIFESVAGDALTPEEVETGQSEMIQWSSLSVPLSDGRRVIIPSGLYANTLVEMVPVIE